MLYSLFLFPAKFLMEVHHHRHFHFRLWPLWWPNGQLPFHLFLQTLLISQVNMTPHDILNTTNLKRFWYLLSVLAHNVIVVGVIEGRLSEANAPQYLRQCGSFFGTRSGKIPPSPRRTGTNSPSRGKPSASLLGQRPREAYGLNHWTPTWSNTEVIVLVTDKESSAVDDK